MSVIDFSKAQFSASYGEPEQLPKAKLSEVIFVGKSNVGKSSLINKLTGIKKLAKASCKPGKTTTINFFECDGIYLVDLPGYGFAKASGAERDRWQRLIDGYFDDERSFNLVISLLDIRHDPTYLDKKLIKFLHDAGFPFMVALTKADKLSTQQQQSQASSIAKILRMNIEDITIVSAVKNIGITDLKKKITDAVV